MSKDDAIKEHYDMTATGTVVFSRLEDLIKLSPWRTYLLETQPTIVVAKQFIVKLIHVNEFPHDIL